MRLKKLNSTMLRYKTIVITICAIILLSNFTGIALSMPNLSQTQPGEFLYENHITQPEYHFMAKGKCYLIIEVQNTDFTNIELDGETYGLSFGLNNFHLDFSDEFKEHILKLPTPLSEFK